MAILTAMQACFYTEGKSLFWLKSKGAWMAGFFSQVILTHKANNTSFKTGQILFKFLFGMILSAIYSGIIRWIIEEKIKKK